MRQHPTIRNGEAGRGACTPECPAVAYEPLLATGIFFNHLSNIINFSNEVLPYHGAVARDGQKGSFDAFGFEC